MMRFSVRSSMYVALWVVAGLLCLSHSEAHAMLPLYAQDAHTQIVNWGPTPTPREPELAELIQKYAVVYAENGSFDNDAPYFGYDAPLQQNPHALMHYVFYGNLRYSGSPHWVDPDRHANKFESNFYHANDPASLTAWYVNDDIVRLHWTPDLRFLTSAEMAGMYDPNNQIPDYQIPTAMRVVRFIITRHEPGRDVVLPARVVPWDGRMDYDKDLFACDDSTGSAAVSYSIESVQPGHPDSDALKFGTLLTPIRPAAEPHFWAVKRNFQEPYYAAADDSVPSAKLPVNWSLSFFVDRELPETTPSLVIRRILTETRNESGVDSTTSIPLTTSYNRVTREISGSIRTQAPDFEKPSKSDWYVRGGVAYQLVYTPPMGPVVVYPEPATFDGVTRSRFMWTSINNRTMGCGWPNYLMNCEGDDWIITVKEMCNLLGTPSAPVTPPLATRSVVYNRLLFDVVMGVVSGHHNLIRPFELATDAQCRTANVTNMESICADFATKGADFGIVCNTADLAFVDACENGNQPKPGFSGVMDENFTNRPEGERALADLLWKFRGHQFAHNLFKNDGNFQNALGDRMQAAAAFLMAREPEYVSDREPRATFGYGEWDTPPSNESALVPIFPEQFISVLRPSLSDPFAATVWPAYSSGPSPWQTEVTSDATAVAWLKSHAAGFVYSIDGVRDFAVSRWELDDGLPGVFNEVIAVWDLGATPGMFTLAQVAPQSSNGTWHKLVIDPDMVIRGGRVSTTPVAATDAIPTVRDQVNIYFSADVHSPVVQPDSTALIPAAAGRTFVLRVAAEHWNGQVLSELRVDGSGIGLAADIQLHDADHDGVYTSSLLTTTQANAVVPHSLPVVAVGNDGLRTYTSVTIPAVAEDVLIGSAAKYPLHANSQDHGVVLAVDVTNFVPLNATTPATVTCASVFGPSNPVTLWDDGPSARPTSQDEVAGDWVFTSDRVTSTLSVAGEHVARVVVHPAAGMDVWRDVSVSAVVSGAEFSNVSQGSGDLKNGSTAQPYSAVCFKTSTIGLNAMIVTFDDAATPPLLLQRTNGPGAPPLFADRRNIWLDAASSLPTHSRGVCYGDYNYDTLNDNSGNVDFFLCGADSSVLYKNVGTTANLPHFTNVTRQAFGSQRPLLNGAVTAAWGDLDNDQDLDLYVGTTDYVDAMSEIWQQTDADFHAYVFENRGGTFNKLLMTTTGATTACLSGAWVNLSHSIRPTLVLPWTPSGNSMLVYRPFVSLNDSTIMSNGAWAVQGIQLNSVNSISVIDYDHIAGLDLLITDVGGAGTAAILRNTSTAGGGTTFEAIAIGAGRRWNGAVVADFDGNRQDDILLLPQAGEPALYMAQNYCTSASPTVYRELAFSLGLRGGTASGGVAVDMGGSARADVYMGRPNTNEFLYQNVGAGTGGGRKVNIACSTVGNSNGAMIGTEVIVEQSGQQWTRMVDGGSGRGGQEANDLQFELGDDSANVSVTVHYPSGDSDSATNLPVDSVFNAIEDTPITLKVGTSSDPDPTFMYEMGPGTVDWIFRWRTVGIKGDQRQDAVTIENFKGYTDQSDCYIGIEPGQTMVLRAGDPGVSARVFQLGADWLHEIRWSGLGCNPGCKYRFKVTSGIGNGITSTGPTCAIPVYNYCLPGEN